MERWYWKNTLAKEKGYMDHCGKADIRNIRYLQPNMAGSLNDQIL